MTQKEANMKVAKCVFSNAFWRAEYFPKYYSESFTMEFPSAPPGMPNYFCTWEAERCFEWLNRTVMSWEVELEEFYSTPDPDQFWGVGICKGDVYWGKTPGHFQSKFFARVEFKDGKIDRMKGWMDAVAFLFAANLDVPAITKKVDDPRIDEWLANTPKRWVADKRDGAKEAVSDPYEGLDMSEEAIQKRLNDNLTAYISGIDRERYRAELESYSPGFKGKGWFIPDFKPWCTLPREEYSIKDNGDPAYQKKDEKSLEAKARERAWVKVSSPWMYRDTRGNIFPTDGDAYFIERMSSGPCLWVGNGFEMGHYHQQYLMVLKVDKAGRVSKREEVLCPQYKYASTQISLPSFPYYA